MVLPEKIKILEGYETAGTIYHFKPEYTFQAYCDADRALYDLMNSYDDFGNTLKKKTLIDHSSNENWMPPSPSRYDSPYKCPWKDEEEFISYFKNIITKKRNRIASFVLFQYQVLLAEEDLPDSTWWVCAYLVKKTLSIAANYPTYRKYNKIGKVYYFDEELTRDDDRREALSGLIEQIKADDSHITIKVKQSLNYLSNEKNRKSAYKSGQKTEENLVKVSGLDRTPNLTKLQMEMLPPPFKAIVAFTKLDKDGKDKGRVLLGQMSSGERQQIFTFATIAYHLFNLLSVQDDERIAYKNVNIVLDELEICFHPELQRSLVNNLLTFLTGLKLNEVIAFNIILSTHSPYILSDMPESNILMLKEGQKEVKKDKCFGANIYDLLCNHFFMNEFIGEFASQKIDSMIDIINAAATSEKERRKLHNVRRDVERISDELIRRKLLERIEVLTTKLDDQ